MSVSYPSSCILRHSQSFVFLGPSELAEIPEGYRPKEYEYNKRPVSRLWAKHFSREQLVYEKSLDRYIQEAERVVIRRIMKHSHDVMKMKQDYQSLYYVPETALYIREQRQTLRRYDFGEFDPTRSDLPPEPKE